ncbi:MAG: hypothetical protein E6J23_01435 [Chloroflexi bacterium]|nr:MAG: hypothetical protein E6J23_01435 [Chloroflexota bacterium]
MGVKSAAVLTLALGALAGALLWLGLWPLAAVALAFLVGGKREPATLAADAMVVLGLAGHADALWVALLLAATLVARQHDPKLTLVLLLASVAATFVYLDWTILTGLLAVIRILFVANRLVFARRLS